ncbi:MAG: MFS transporter [Candidatus Rokubacteria bacterium]|nr:MFS transporter [Candidatus Rokubacteria bacterium]
MTATPTPPAARRVEPTAALVFAAKAARTFCYGFLGVLFPVHLSTLGLGPEGIGVAVALTLAGTAAMTVALRRPAERFGARAVLMGLAALIVVSGALFAVTRHPALAVAAAVIGNLAVSVGETGPFLTIEQVLVARAAAGPGLTAAMSRYNLVGYAAAALGALSVTAAARPGAGGPATLTYQPLFWLFAASGVVQIFLYARLGPLTAGTPVPARRPLPSRGLIYRLAALFALDALAGGFVVQSLVAYWFFVHFGLDPPSLGGIFAGTHVLTALSFLLAPRAAARLGLVNTMVFSHLVSNAILMAIAFAPTVTIAVSLLLARHLLSQMDVPTRQAYLMGAVLDHEREAAAAITNAARTVAQSLTPAVTGFVMQAVHVSAPFVLGGGLKIVYDLLLYAAVRGVKPRDEAARAAGIRSGGRGG